MKKTFTLLSLVALSTLSYAQYVGVNTTAPQTTLDVTAKNPALATETQIDGVMAPRVSMARAEAMGTTVPNGNLIFVNDLTAPTTIATTSLVTATGFYYYDAVKIKWIPINFSDNDWHTTGNAGTTVGTNFLGTTDDEPLMFKTNSVQSGYIDNVSTLGNTSFGYNALLAGPAYNTANGGTTNNANTAVGYNALAKLGTVAGTWQTSNVAVGNGAMGNLLGGAWNTAIGTNAMGQATGDPTTLSTMRNNVAIGISALASLNKGAFNLAIGPNAMSQAKTVLATDVLNGNTAIGLVPLDVIENGTQNLALGYFTAQQFKSGSNNVFLGAFSGASLTQGDNNISIGQQTQFFNNTGSGQINVGNVIVGTGSSNNPAVSTTKKIGINLAAAPNSTLQVGGSFSAPIRKGSGAVLDSDYTLLGSGDFTLPSASGLNGRIYNFIYDGTNFAINGSLRLDGGVISSYGINNAGSMKRITVQSDGTNWVILF